VQIIEKEAALLGLRVVTLMHRRGLSLRQLAVASRVPLSTIQKILKGESKQPSIWTIVALARVLNVSTDFLVGRTNVEQLFIA
jgi:transcriptional regulator with XRE-family HTH domain